jgi:hypothetical protein
MSCARVLHEMGRRGIWFAARGPVIGADCSSPANPRMTADSAERRRRAREREMAAWMLQRLVVAAATTALVTTALVTVGHVWPARVASRGEAPHGWSGYSLENEWKLFLS